MRRSLQTYIKFSCDRLPKIENTDTKIKPVEMSVSKNLIHAFVKNLHDTVSKILI